MATSARRASGLTALGLLGLLGSCSEVGRAPAEPVEETSTSAAIVSDPLPNVSPASSARSGAHPPSGVSLAVAVAAAEGDVAYISLPANTYPEGATAVIGNPRLGVTVTAPIIDGGLDPVPVPASAGDILEIEILLASGASAALLKEKVPVRRRPTVVRTVPPRGKTDVALNSRMVIVFSEPLDEASLSPSSVQLFRGASPVPGTVRPVAGLAAAVVFEASTELDANTEYRLVVTDAVRDLDGDALDAATTVSFTTGTTREGPIASLSLTPRGGNVRIGARFQVIVTARDARGAVLAGRPVRWTSSNRAVATVSGTGLVTAVADGWSIITAQVEGWFVTMYVGVFESMVPAASVTLTVDSATVTPGGTLELAVEARDAQGGLIEGRLVTWTTSNPSVTAVAPTADDRARVTGVADGVARIVATIEGRSDTTVVTVGPPPPMVGLIIAPDDATLLLRDTTRVSALSRNAAGGRTAVAPDQVAWASADPTVASVDGVGLVTGVGSGSTTITGTWSGFTSTARVTVVEVVLAALSAGRGHTCGVTVSGAAYCWGENDFGQAGKPGLALDPGIIPPRFARIRFPAPVRVAEELTLVGVSAGAWYTCGLEADGAAHCWGYNGEGALGDGTLASSWRPVRVAGGHAFVALDAGLRHACGLTAAGAAYCWGANRDGELGDGTFVGSPTPVRVAGGRTFAAISAGESHTCGLTPAGAAYCWGRNSSGQLGVGAAVAGSTTPLAVAGELTFATLDAGAAHTCGVTTAGVAYCWGWNFDGELGNDAPFSFSPTPASVAGGLRFVAIAAGRSHTCGVDADAAAHCWGQNLNGRLGTGTVAAGVFATPQRVAGGVRYSRVTVGAVHACALAADSAWHCWGENSTGALGIGTTTHSGMPVKVLGQR